MSASISPLPTELNEIISLPKLPRINSQFYVPSIDEKPQNPILDTLKLNDRSRLNYLPKEFDIIHEQSLSTPSPPLEESIWLNAIQVRRSNQIHSWDTLRSNVPKSASLSGFLTEQDATVFAAAHHQTLPVLQDPRSAVQYILLHDLLKNMKLTALGFSSLLHEWDPSQEQFVDIGIEKGTQRRIIIEGKDEAISSNFISRFVRIGTLLRRLELLVAHLRSRSNIGPTIHAFAHATSTSIVRIRKSLASGPPSETQLSTNQVALNSVLKFYGPHEEILRSLSALFKQQGEMLSTQDYESIPASPQDLLSLIYDHLQNHIEHQSSHLVIATFAFILTSSSSEYFRGISRSTGFGPSKVSPNVNDNAGSRKGYPTFFPSELVSVLPVAQKSLSLLQTAQPDHPLLENAKQLPDIQWFWTLDEILAAMKGTETPGSVGAAVLKAGAQSPSSSTTYLPEIAEFQIFDLEPGSSIGPSCFDTAFSSAPTLALENFIAAFPQSLPPIVPTLTHLTSLVMKPLLLHARTLSTTLLFYFLALPPPLNIHSHLQLMRSYMLLMSPSFRMRLSAALFSDTGDFDADVRKSSEAFSPGPGPQSTDLQNTSWAVGLAPALLEKATWPPMDSDLSFFLRTVILDSFEVGTRRNRAEEIENRLGFVVRDLSTEPGQDAWLDPLHIEALDFLYMDYKPPQPLNVIITPNIVSKYQRIFSFLLQILRVQHAIHAAFRMSNSANPFVFGTLASSRKRLLHFRFIAQSFVTALAEYVYDTAIVGNLDPFLAKLEENKGQDIEYPDVFSLSEAHSDVMNAILAACLLRTGQKVAGGVLRDALKLVLDFAVLVGELYRGRIEEYQAAPLLENLYIRYQRKIIGLIKVLNEMVDKNVSMRASVEVSHSLGVQEKRRSIGGIEALSHLLVRLDVDSARAK